MGVLNTSGDDGDTDGDENGGEINVSKNGDFGKRRRHGEEHENDSRDKTKDDGAGAVVGNVVQGNGSRQTVRTNGENEFERKHDTHELVAKLAHQQASSIGVVGDMRVFQLDLTDNVRRVHGDETQADAQNHTGDHAQRGKGRGNTERAERDGLNQEDNGQALPSQAVEMGGTLGGLLLLDVVAVQLLDVAQVVVGDTACRIGVRTLERHLLHGLRGGTRGDSGAARHLVCRLL